MTNTAAFQKKIKDELDKAREFSASEDNSKEVTDFFDASSTHLQDEAGDSRASRRREKKQEIDELKGNEIRLSRESLRRVTHNSLAHPKNANPSYKYAWLSTSPDASPNYYDAVNKFGYIPCSIDDYPEMSAFDYRTEDSNKQMGRDKIVYKEMILCKIHISNWNVLMIEFHHTVPNEMAHDIEVRHKESILARGKHVRDVSPEFLNANGDIDIDIKGMGVTVNNQGRTVFTKEPVFNNV